MDGMVLTNHILKRFDSFGDNSMLISLNIMWIGFKIYKSATGKVLTLVLIMGSSNQNGYRPEKWNPTDIS